MDRRTYLAFAASGLAATAGCTTSSGSSADAEADAAQEEYLEGESHPDVVLEEHAFEELDQTSGVTGVVTNDSDNRADIRVSINFIDEADTVIGESYTLLTDIASGQSAEFTVRFPDDDVDRVDTYELILDLR